MSLRYGGKLRVVAHTNELVELLGDFTDSITCYNEFIGGQVGGTLRWRWDRLSLDTTVKLAVGQNYQTIKSFGRVVQTDNQTGDTTVSNEGLYVQSTNSGNHHSQHISIVPEFDLSVGIFLTDNFRFSIGCGGFNMSNALRPSAVLERRIEVQAPGIPTTNPARRFQQTDFWAEWVSFGFEFMY